MESIQFPEHITKIITEKNYYKKYSYKICFQIDMHALSSTERSRFSSKYWSDRAVLRKKLKDQIIRLLPKDFDCRLRTEAENVNIFLDDEIVASNLISKLIDRVKEVHMPLNAEHKQLIHDNHRIRVRKTLFHNRYRFKLNIKNNWGDRFKKFDDLQEWLAAMGADENRWMPNAPLQSVFKLTEEERNKPKFRYRFSNYALFLNEEQDVMMLQLWLNEWYGYTEKAVLISEI